MKTNRMDDMLCRYGECCTQVKAAHILGVTARTIHRMLEDGRIRRIGTMVDVRSIASYLENPAEKDFQSRRRASPARSPWTNFGRPSDARL